MSASPSECRDRRDEIIDAIREAGIDQDASPLLRVPGLVEDAVDAGCIDGAHGEAIVEAVRDLGDSPTVSQGQPIRKRVRAAFADATQDFGDIQAQRDEQTTLGESQRPQRRQVEEGARREDPEQGQVSFGDRGELRGQEQLGGGFAGPRPEEGDESEEREGRRAEGARSLREFVEGEGEGPPPGEAAPPEREKREWTESQDRATADKHYFALHFEGSVSAADTRRLLNKFQDARRVINLAKTSPETLRAMQGIGDRTVEKLAQLDPDEAVKTPRERGTSERKLREAGVGPEGEGLGGFEGEGEGEGPPPGQAGESPGPSLERRLRDLGMPGNGVQALMRTYDSWDEIEAATLGEVFDIAGVGRKAMEALVPSGFDFRSRTLTVGEARERGSPAPSQAGQDRSPSDSPEGFDKENRVEHDDGRRGTVVDLTPSAIKVDYDEGGDAVVTSPAVLTVIEDGAGEDEQATVTMRDPETGESTTLDVPREVNGWVYDPDAPGAHGTVVWTPPGEPDRFVAIEKTGGHTWAAFHRDRSDVGPGEPPENEEFLPSQTPEDALEDAIRMMEERDLGTPRERIAELLTRHSPQELKDSFREIPAPRDDPVSFEDFDTLQDVAGEIGADDMMALIDEVDGDDDGEDEYPIKVRFTGDARTKFHSRQLEPMHGTPTEQLSQGEDMLHRATDVAGREKTNLVVRSDDELEAILTNLRQFRDLANPATGASWATRNHLKAVDRVISELESNEGEGDLGNG